MSTYHGIEIRGHLLSPERIPVGYLKMQVRVGLQKILGNANGRISEGITRIVDPNPPCGKGSILGVRHDIRCV
jgi:hypothetical protein